jgi:hypothetical protein
MWEQWALDNECHTYGVTKLSNHSTQKNNVKSYVDLLTFLVQCCANAIPLLFNPMAFFDGCWTSGPSSFPKLLRRREMSLDENKY